MLSGLEVGTTSKCSLAHSSQHPMKSWHHPLSTMYLFFLSAYFDRPTKTKASLDLQMAKPNRSFLNRFFFVCFEWEQGKGHMRCTGVCKFKALEELKST